VLPALGHAPPEDPKENIGVITRIAQEAIDQLGPVHGDLVESVKSLCAVRRIAYGARQTWRLR